MSKIYDVVLDMDLFKVEQLEIEVNKGELLMMMMMNNLLISSIDE